MSSKKELSPNEYVVGTCTTMCPKKEMLLRERERLLHKYEIQVTGEIKKPPKADPDKVVKCFSRSAAGCKVNPSDVRPYSVLLKTVKYLFHEIFPLHKSEPLTVYDFMFDRLRSVRQDMVMQNLPPFDVIKLMEPIARFHIYFGYILAEEGHEKFDIHINDSHLQECLNRLLFYYDAYENEKNLVLKGVHKLVRDEIYIKNRCDFENAYLLFNLSNFEAVTRGLKLPAIYVSKEILALSTAWYLKNYVRTLQSLKLLPPLLLCCVLRHLPEIRRYALQAMSCSFSCSNSSYPVSQLKNLLLYETDTEVLNDCNHFNINVTENMKNVNFLKKNFDKSADLREFKRLYWVDNILAKYDLVQLLWCGND